MNTKITMKILGLVATIICCGANILSDYVNNKQMQDTIKNEVAKALAEKN